VRNIKVVRYINGKEVGEDDLQKYALESEIVPRTIKTVNERLRSQRGER
jgi:hypothetical protein